MERYFPAYDRYPTKGSDGVSCNRPRLPFCSAPHPCLIRRLRKRIEKWAFEDIAYGLVVGNGHATTEVMYARSALLWHRPSGGVAWHSASMLGARTKHICFPGYVNGI